MSYERFIEEVLSILRNRVGETTGLSVQTVVKNNGCKRKGIAFSETGSSVSPNIYLEEYYEEYRAGGNIEKIAGQVLEMFRKVRAGCRLEGKDVLCYQNVKDRIIYKLVNREKNRELLLRAPHVEYLDLAALFYVLVDMDEDGEGIAIMLIRNEHLNMWKVTEEEIRRRAEVNTERLLPYEFAPMSTVIKGMLENGGADGGCLKMIDEHVEVYVLTNRIWNNGAAAILYAGRLDAIGDFLKENYYILPSSTCETIIIPERAGIPQKEMEQMVQEVNETQMEEEEFLSDHVYYYDRVKKEASIA